MPHVIAQLEAPASEMGADLLHKFSEFNKALASEGLLPICLLGSFFVLVLIASAAFSASIAESRIRNRNFHFLLGFLLPVLYPAAAFALMKRRRFKSEEEEEESEFKSSTKVAEDAQDTGLRDFDNLFNHDYFKEMMFDNNGSLRGPFQMRIDDVDLRVERISDVLPKVVVIETINADGNQQTMRLPFERITGCREI